MPSADACSARSFHSRVGGRRRHSRSALLIGNPTADLPETAAEIEQVAALIEAMPGAAAPRILMQRRATKTTILQELASGRYDLLHYAGHAQFVAGRPEASGLVLARHELLTALELQQSLAGQPFVFLNGCESALDEVMSPANVDQPAGAGATVHGLAAAFLLGGACGLVGTQWPINDSSSRDFAAAFYRAILQGERVDRAVQQARTHVQKNQPRDPLWAAFTLYAEPDQPLVLRSQRTKRPATVLTCDLRMLTARFATENGERLSQTIDLLHSHIAGQINRAGGHLLPVAGDQLLALFSPTPTAPNDAERALRTAQTLIQSWSATNATHFPASIGVSSGELHWSMLPTTTALPVLGEPVRVAGRLAQLAAPGEVLVDAAVHQLTRRLFAFLPVVGKATTASAPGRPTIFQLSSMEAHGRSSPLWVDTRTRFVGRTRELTELHELWRRCQPQGSQGKIQGQLVGIAGEAGIGKSRLIQAFADELADAQSAGVPPQWIQTHCIAAYQPGPYEVVLQLLKPLLGLDASPSERQLDHAAFSTALQQVPGLTAIQQTETVALLCELFDLPALPGQPLVHLDRQSRQRRLVNLSGTLLAARTARGPLILVIDDLQWADESSLEILDQLAGGLERLPLLFVVLFRSEQAGNHRGGIGATTTNFTWTLADTATIALLRETSPQQHFRPKSNMPCSHAAVVTRSLPKSWLQRWSKRARCGRIKMAGSCNRPRQWNRFPDRSSVCC
ncbi:MAG: CHAT domain-containing protein [Caldilineaceae bacterium]